MWQKIIGVCIAMLIPLEQTAWAMSQRDALAPKSVFSERAESKKAAAIVTAKDLKPYYDRAVRFFSTATTPQEVAELTQTLIEKTVFSDKPLASERGISRPLIVFLIASAAALLGMFGLYPWSNYWNDIVLAMISGTVAGKSLSDMLSDHFLEGRLMIEDFIFFRWKKILALIALKDSDKQDTLAATHSRIGPDGSRVLVSIEYYSGDTKLDRNAAHEAVHALKLLGKLKISTPEHEFVLAHALTALDDLEFYLREMTTHIAPEKVTLKIEDDYGLGYEIEPFRRLRNEIEGMIVFPTAVPPGSTANSIEQILSRLSRFSSTFRRHEALLRKRGIVNLSEHLLPLRFKGFIWASAARAVADRQGGAGLGAYTMLKNLAAAAPNPNDTEFLKLLKQSAMETRAIIESSRQRVQHLPEPVRRQVMDLVLQGSIGPAGKLLPDVTPQRGPAAGLSKPEYSPAISEHPDRSFQKLEERMGTAQAEKSRSLHWSDKAAFTKLPVQVPRSLGCTSAQIARALEEPFEPEQLIRVLKRDPYLKGLFEKPAGYWGKTPLPYTLEQHTLRVMRQFEKYFSDTPLPGNVSKRLFRLLLVLHDIGKPFTEGQADTSRQYEYTPAVIDGLRSVLPFARQDIDLVIALIQGDCIGAYLRGGISLHTAVEKIKDAAARTDRSLKDFFTLMTLFYQSDAASYTLDAGYRSNWLAGLFQYDNATGRFIYDRSRRRLLFSTEKGFLPSTIGGDAIIMQSL